MLSLFLFGKSFPKNHKSFFYRMNVTTINHIGEEIYSKENYQENGVVEDNSLGLKMQFGKIA